MQKIVPSGHSGQRRNPIKYISSSKDKCAKVAAGTRALQSGSPCSYATFCSTIGRLSWHATLRSGLLATVNRVYGDFRDIEKR